MNAARLAEIGATPPDWVTTDTIPDLITALREARELAERLAGRLDAWAPKVSTQTPDPERPEIVIVDRVHRPDVAAALADYKAKKETW